MHVFFEYYFEENKGIKKHLKEKNGNKMNFTVKFTG